MAIPQVNVTILDGALGLAADSSARIQAKVGTCSSGTANVLTAVSTISDLVATFGHGPLVEAAARTLAIAGGPVYCMRITSDVAAVAGAASTTGTSTATLTLAGTPNDSYSLVVLIVQGAGTLSAGTATMQYSLDGGRTYSPTLTIPAAGTYLMPNTGVTLTFAYTSGTAFVAGDTYTATTTAPGYTTTALGTTFTALLADPRTWFMVHVVGPPADLAGARTLFAALATQMATAATSYRYAFAMMEAPAGTDAALLANVTGFGDEADSRVAVAAGYLNATSPVSGAQYSRSVAWEASAWLSAIAPSDDLGAVARGPLTGVSRLGRDEQATPGLDAGRMTTARSIIGRQGYYLTRGRILASVGSDFALIQNRRVIDIASSTARDGALQFLNAKVAANANGTIQDKAAKAIEDYIREKLEDALTRKGDAIGTTVAVDRTVNIVSTGLLKLKVRVRPYGYASDIEVELGFTSPSLAQAA